MFTECKEAFLAPSLSIGAGDVPWVDMEAPRATPLVRDEKKEEAEAAEGTNVSPQRLRDPVEQCCRQTSLNSAPKPKS